MLRESLDDTLHHVLPWDIELIIDDPNDEPEEEDLRKNLKFFQVPETIIESI